MNEIIKEIVEMEYEMFDRVQNESGRASCQDDFITFEIMRTSQFQAWDEESLISYMKDLKSAHENGVNLIAQKYGYMMEYTAPQQYDSIKDKLTTVPDEKRLLVNKLVNIHVKWLENLAQEFPKLTGRGRSIHLGEESPYGGTSFETYIIGEMLTYSMDTLKKYEKYIESLLAADKNINRIILYNTVKRYGYASLEDAEEKN